MVTSETVSNSRYLSKKSIYKRRGRITKIYSNIIMVDCWDDEKNKHEHDFCIFPMLIIFLTKW